MKPYVMLGDLRLKITTATAIELEDHLNCSIIDGLYRLTEVRIIVRFLYAASQSLNDSIKTIDDVYDFVDEFTVDHDIEEIQEAIIETLANCGYITKEANEERKKLQAQTREKLKAKTDSLLS